MKFRSILRKEAYVVAFLISESNLFHSFIAHGKKFFFKDTVRQMSHKYKLYYTMIFEKEELDHEVGKLFCIYNFVQIT